MTVLMCWSSSQVKRVELLLVRDILFSLLLFSTAKIHSQLDKSTHTHTVQVHCTRLDVVVLVNTFYQDFSRKCLCEFVWVTRYIWETPRGKIAWCTTCNHVLGHIHMKCVCVCVYVLLNHNNEPRHVPLLTGFPLAFFFFFTLPWQSRVHLYTLSHALVFPSAILSLRFVIAYKHIHFSIIKCRATMVYTRHSGFCFTLYM